MTNFMTQVNLNFKRLVWRNPRFAFFDVMLPAGFYVLFTKVMAHGLPGNFNQTYLISMTIYATLLSSIMTVANTAFADRQQRLVRLVTVSPTSKSQYYAATGVVLGCLTLLEVGIIEIIAGWYVGVSLSAVNWLLILTLVTLSSLPLMILGVGLAQANSASLINLLTSLTVFPVAMLSGLWWPLSTMPTWVQHIGELLPTYQTSAIVNALISQRTVDEGWILGELCWLVASVGVVVGMQQLGKRGDA